MAAPVEKMRKWRAADRVADNCIDDPLLALRHGLALVPGGDVPAAPSWNSVVHAGVGHAMHDYAKSVRSKRLFAVGGLQVLIECGMVNDWYRNDANRTEALRLIKDRGHRPLLDTLGDREPENSIFGKNELGNFFQYFPPVHRDNDHPGSKRSRDPLGARVVRRDFPLRLRKALEFLYLTEAVLRWRFRIDETKRRFKELTGHTVTHIDDARLIWDYMWIEPLFYVVDPEPRAPDVSRIVGQQIANPATFTNACGQPPAVLNSILRGVPGSYDVVAAAGTACDSFYPSGAAATVALTVAPDSYERRLGRLQESPLLKEGGAVVENIVQLTPHP